MATPVVPTISPASRTFSTATTCDISIGTGYQLGDRIHYTTDGSEVTTNSDYVISNRTPQISILPGATRVVRAKSYRAGSGLSAEATVTYTYVDLNTAPVFSPLQASNLGSYLQGTTGSIRIRVNDDALPNNTLTYSIAQGALPTGLSLDSATGIISGTVTGSPGTYTFKIEASDGDKSTIRPNDFTITVAANPYAPPLSLPFIPSTLLDARVDLRVRTLFQTSPTTASMLVTWGKFGIADCQNTVIHMLTVRRGATVLPEFPIQFIEDNAYNNRYSYIIKDWDLTQDYVVSILINYNYLQEIKISKKVTVVESKSAIFNENQTICKFTNKAAGIGVKIMSCQLNLDRDIRNVLVYKLEGRQHPLQELSIAAIRSVPIQVTLPSQLSDYTGAVIGGVYTTPITQDQFNSIFSDRKSVIASITYRDSDANYIEETNQSIITYTPKKKIYEVDSFAGLSKSVHNLRDVLYYAATEDKYYRYRETPVHVPLQGYSSLPSPRQQWLELKDIDRDMDGTFMLYVPVVKCKVTTTAEISFSVRNSSGDYLLYSTPITTNTFSTYIQASYPGASIMRENSEHTDTTVASDKWYTYETVIEFWDGVRFSVGRKAVRREVVSDTVLSSKVTLDNLSIPINGNGTLTEYDFQSGISPKMRAYFSYNKADFDGYFITKAIEKHCGCDWPEACNG